MFRPQADNLGDALRLGPIATLGASIKLTVPQTVEIEKPVSDALRTAIGTSCEAVYTLLFGSAFWQAMGDHHREAAEWHFESRLAFLEKRKPDYLAYFPIWSRGHMKTTIAEHMIVVDAVLSVAFGEPGYCLFIGREKDKVKENIGNIETLLTSGAILIHCPSLSRVARSQETNQKRQWSATLLHTAGRYVVKGGSIESSQAGSRVDKTRPTWIVLDDIDGREDSAVITQMRLKRLTGEILPMRQANTLTYFAQNVISRFTVMYQIHSQQVQVLTNRKPTKPVPAVELPFVTERRTKPNGIIYDHFLPEASGKITWHMWDAVRVQEEIESEGLAAFEAECQHNVAQARVGLFHKAYNDDVHAISYSQFAAVFGSRDAWKRWNKVLFSDWARTKTKFHANVAGFLSVVSASHKFAGMTFLTPMSFEEGVTAADCADRFLTELTPQAYSEGGHSATWSELIDQAWKRTNAQTHFDTVAQRLDFERNFYSKLIPKYSRPVLNAYRVRGAVMSHSEDKVRDVFNDGFGFSFEPANPGKTEGLESIDEAMRVDYNLPHLFGRLDEDGAPVKGYTRWYVLCPDDLSSPPTILNGVEVYQPLPYPKTTVPDDLHDSDLFRYQMYNRRFKPPKMVAGGELIDDPEKSDDDFGQGLQMVYFKDLLSNIRLTPDEVEELSIAPAFRLDNIKAKQEKGEISESEYGQLLITRKAKLTIPKILSGKAQPTSRFSKFKKK